ncbi:hypothetical protein A1OQ_21965 [Enterovibrio norvegicus FF-162]|uniref:hypothetical protein n=1 Tax=Enterovibrio norvegicus TaxID=188144 RepID=UPI00030D542B|nr:hypothetical protein [Enterovibrio norvegicus]OEE77746.1 hypothetical protein A1OQ_21965 [Enterovibrio norvegicus FF-162]
MAKASEVLKKHISLVEALQKVSHPDKEPDPIGRTKANALAQQSRVERRIADLEQQRAVFNKQIDESIQREREHLKEIGKFEDMVSQTTEPKKEQPKEAPIKQEEIRPEKPAPKPRPKTTRNVDAKLKAAPTEKAAARRKATLRQPVKGRPTKK